MKLLCRVNPQHPVSILEPFPYERKPMNILCDYRNENTLGVEIKFASRASTFYCFFFATEDRNKNSVINVCLLQLLFEHENSFDVCVAYGREQKG